jgi:hypothetical protein
MSGHGHVYDHVYDHDFPRLVRDLGEPARASRSEGLDYFWQVNGPLLARNHGVPLRLSLGLNVTAALR